MEYFYLNNTILKLRNPSCMPELGRQVDSSQEVSADVYQVLNLCFVPQLLHLANLK